MNTPLESTHGDVIASGEDHADREGRQAFDFIGSLCESKLIRSIDNLCKYSARDVADFAFLNFLAIETLRNIAPQAALVSVYAGNVIRYGSFDRFYGGANDLYTLLYVLTDRTVALKLKADRGNDLLLKCLVLDRARIKYYLRYVAAGDEDTSAKGFLMKLEQGLRIANSEYRSIRRTISDLNELDLEERRDVVKRLARLFRTKMPNSELGPLLESAYSKICE